jgi:hypothetical protein
MRLVAIAVPLTPSAAGGDGHVVGGWKNKVQSAVANVTAFDGSGRVPETILSVFANVACGPLLPK